MSVTEMSDPVGRPDRGLVHHEITRAVIGAFYRLYADLGSGFLEAVYSNGMALLLREAGLQVRREQLFEIIYHDVVIGRYRADLIVESSVILEIKTGQKIDPIHPVLLRNYLRASRLEVGLLLNFGHRPEFRRVIQSISGPADPVQ